MKLNHWKNKPKSYLVKWLLEYGGATYDEAAIVLNTSKAYFNNKLIRNSFSFEDIIAIAELCRYEAIFRIQDNSIDEDQPSLLASPAIFCDTEVYDRIKKVYEMREERLKEEEKKLLHQKEYLRMKQELADYKAKYGIKD